MADMTGLRHVSGGDQFARLGSDSVALTEARALSSATAGPRAQVPSTLRKLHAGDETADIRSWRAEAKVLCAEVGGATEAGAVRAKELSALLERWMADSRPFGQHSRSSSSDESSGGSAADLSPYSCTRSGGAATADAGDGASRKESGSGKANRRRRKAARGKKGKAKPELCPCGCAQLVPVVAVAEQRKAQSPPLNNPFSARLFGQLSVSATCPVESPFLDSLVRSLAHDASDARNGEEEAAPACPISEATKSPSGESFAVGYLERRNVSCGFADDTEGRGKRGDCGGASAELLNRSWRNGASAAEPTRADEGQNYQQVADDKRRMRNSYDDNRRGVISYRNEDVAPSQPNFPLPAAYTKTRHVDRSSAVARWIVSPASPYSSGRTRSSSHSSCERSSSPSSGIRSEPTTRPPSGRTESVSARQQHQPVDSRLSASEPATQAVAEAGESVRRSPRYKPLSPGSCGRGDNKEGKEEGEASISIKRQLFHKSPKSEAGLQGKTRPPKWQWLPKLHVPMPWSQHPRAVEAQPGLVL